MSLPTARAISAYLLTGMHHATPEGQAAIAQIIEEHLADTVTTEQSVFSYLRDPKRVTP